MEDSVEKIPIIIRKKFTMEQKVRILGELETGFITQLSLARKYGIAPITIYNWKKKMNSKAETEQEISLKKLKEELEKLELENKLLKKIVADKDITIEILQVANGVMKKKVALQQQKSQKTR